MLEIMIFCNLSNEKAWFSRVQGLQFSIIFVIVFGPPPGHHFQCFCVDLWVGRAPVLEPMGFILWRQKKKRKKSCECMRVYAKRGGGTLQRSRICPSGMASHISSPQRGLKARWRIYIYILRLRPCRRPLWQSQASWLLAWWLGNILIDLLACWVWLPGFAGLFRFC